MCLHACAAGPVDDDRPARLVHIMLHAKVGRYPMDQHTVVRRHLRELLKGTERDRNRDMCGSEDGKVSKGGKKKGRKEGKEIQNEEAFKESGRMEGGEEK